MKKKLATIFSSLALVAMLIATLCACSTYGSVKSEYESKGWTENENCVKLQETLLKNALGEDYAQTCKIHALAKNGSILNYVVILEFKSTDEMNKKINESETLKGMIKRRPEFRLGQPKLRSSLFHDERRQRNIQELQINCKIPSSEGIFILRKPLKISCFFLKNMLYS